jgi:hypothetical protein
MPLIRYSCSCGHSQGKFFRSGAQAPGLLPCSKCDLEMKRTLSGPSADTKITVDNGAQARAVLINVDQIKDNQNKARFIAKLREKP